jgi:U3 small nucleolar RNA-associated protein 20
VEHSRLAVQLCGIFVTVEKSDFENRLPTLFPLIIQQFNLDSTGDSLPGRFVRIAPLNDENPTELEKNQRIGDHLLFQVLQLLLKMCTCCADILTEPKWQEDMETITGRVLFLLGSFCTW